jgi:uncharacterized protein involved in exopolysaccharide biosynthesis
MEFIEYYQIIRSRIWIAIMMAAAAFVVATVYQLLPPSGWPAYGRMQANEAMAARQVDVQGQKAGFTQDPDFWGTLEQIATGPWLLDQAAQRIQLDPVAISHLKQFEFQRPKRGGVFTVTGTGRSTKEAVLLTDAGMAVLAAWCSDNRLARLDYIRRQLESTRAAADRRMADLRRLMDTTHPGDLPGSPPDVLTWIQGQLNTLQGAIASGQIEIGIAQDRVQRLHSLADRERALPPEQRMLSSANTQSLTGLLQNRLLQLEAARMTMLYTRTESHPQVVAVTQELAAVRRRLAEETRKEAALASGGGLPSALQEQITLAELDAAAAQRRVDALKSQDADLRQRMPGVQARARQYAGWDVELKSQTVARESAAANLELVNGEMMRLSTKDANTMDLKVETKATALPNPKTIAKYLMLLVALCATSFIVGCVLIFALHSIDLTFKNEAEAEQLLGYPILAGIPRSDIVFMPPMSTEVGGAQFSVDGVSADEAPSKPDRPDNTGG